MVKSFWNSGSGTFAKNDASVLVIVLVFISNDSGRWITIEIGEGLSKIGRQFEHQVIEHLAALNRREYHLKVVRILVDVEEKASLVALVQWHTFDHFGREQPMVNLPAFPLK